MSPRRAIPPKKTTSPTSEPVVSRRPLATGEVYRIAHTNRARGEHLQEHPAPSGGPANEVSNRFTEFPGHAATRGAVAFDREFDIADDDPGTDGKVLEAFEVDGDVFAEDSGSVTEIVQFLYGAERSLPSTLAEGVVADESFSADGIERFHGDNHATGRFELEMYDVPHRDASFRYGEEGGAHGTNVRPQGVAGGSKG